MQTLLAVGDNVTITDTFPMDSLLPSNREDYYRYNGSAMSPPCYQSVNWTVFKEPISISASQVISVHFNSPTPGNRRVSRCSVTACLRPYSIRPSRVSIQIHSESEFGLKLTGKSNGLDSWVLSEVTSLLFVYVCDTAVHFRFR